MKILVPCLNAIVENFTSVRPNYLLADYSSKRLIELCVESYLAEHEVILLIPESHVLDFGAKNTLLDIFGDALQIIVLPSYVTTDVKAVQYYFTLNKQCEPFHIKPCNGISRLDLHAENEVYLDHKTGYPIAYTFMSAEEFLNDLDICTSVPDVDQLISITNPVTHYVDNFINLTTKDAWQAWANRPTLFCDIDGTIIHNKSPYGPNNYGTPAIPLQENVACLLEFLAKGYQIVFTTSRKAEWFYLTRRMLDDFGFTNCQLLMGMHHSTRILINDYAPTNPFPSAIAINLERNADNLRELLEKDVRS